MFKRIEFILTEPVCECPKGVAKFKWSISPNGNAMMVGCAACNTQLLIPQEKLCARCRIVPSEKAVPTPPPPRKAKKTFKKPSWMRVLDGGKTQSKNSSTS